jgi:hypothetical protein
MIRVPDTARVITAIDAMIPTRVFFTKGAGHVNLSYERLIRGSAQLTIYAIIRACLIWDDIDAK